MLSRVASSVHWMSRYIERAENVARFVSVTDALSLGDSALVNNQWSPLVYTTGDHEDFEARYSEATRENVLTFLLFDKKNANSILSCISNARESARTVREVLPSEVWEQLNKFWRLVVRASSEGHVEKQPYDFCESVRMASHLIFGAAQSSMLRDEAWSFLQAGRNLERADKTSRIVDVQYYMLLPKLEDVGQSVDINRWSAMLRSVGALQMYRRTYGRMSPSKVARFLILDDRFPRSIRCCVQDVEACLLEMAPAQGQAESRVLKSELLAGQLSGRLSQLTIEEIIDQGMHAFIDQLQGALNSLGIAINDDFFDVQAQQRRLIQRNPEPQVSQQQQQN